MANQYQSIYSGEHNDNYENRIKALEEAIVNINNRFNNYLPLSGGEVSGDIFMLNGKNINFVGDSTNDTGDLVWLKNDKNTEQGRLYVPTSGQLYYRKSADAASIIISNMSMTPTNTRTTITRTLTATPGNTWTKFMNDCTPPTNGYMYALMTGTSNTPSAYFATSGYQYRGNGNGGRDFALFMPVAKGQAVSGQCVYCYPSQIYFISAAVEGY